MGKYLEDLNSEDYVAVYEENDLNSYKEMLGLPNDITGIVLEQGVIENGGIGPKDLIYTTTSSTPYDLRTFYDEVFYEDLQEETKMEIYRKKYPYAYSVIGHFINKKYDDGKIDQILKEEFTRTLQGEDKYLELNEMIFNYEYSFLENIEDINAQAKEIINDDPNATFEVDFDAFKDEIEKNYPSGTTAIDIYYEYELSDEIISKIANAKSKDEIKEILLDEENRILDLDDNIKITEVANEIVSQYGVDFDDAFDYVADNGVVCVDRKDILNGWIKADIYPKDADGNYLEIEGVESLCELNDSYLNEEDDDLYASSENALKGMKLLGVNPYEVGEILKERGDIEKNALPKIEFENGLDAKKYFEEVENATYGGDLMFTASIDIEDYVENFDLIQKRGLLIPAGTDFGYIDSNNGSCGFIGYETTKDIILDSDSFDLVDDRKHFGYGLDEIAGVVDSIWKDNELSFPKTDLEKSIINTLNDLKKETSKSGPETTQKALEGFVSIQFNSFKRQHIEDNPFTFDKIKESVENFYYIDTTEELNSSVELIMEHTKELRDMFDTNKKNEQSKSAKLIEDFIDDCKNKQDQKTNIEQIIK